MTKEERFEEYKSWCVKNNKLPSQTSKNPTEKSLGEWRNGINSRFRNWEQLIEFNSQFEKNRRTKEDRFEKEYVPWCLEHNMTPNSYSKDPIEKSLGQWKSVYRNWEQLMEFNSQFEKKRKSREERFEEYKFWCLKNNKLPNSESKDYNERSLRLWIYNHRNWEPLVKFNSLMEQYQKGNSDAILLVNILKEKLK